MSHYDHYLTQPNHRTSTYYLERLEDWVPIDENFELNLSLCSQPGDVIDESNRDKLLWYYSHTTKQLFIPSKNAASILIYKYNNDPDITPIESFCPNDEIAKRWLRCLGFCGAFICAGAKSIYAGVSGPKVPARVQHCYVFDMSLSDEERDEKRPTVEELLAMQTNTSPLYASPTNWLVRRQLGDFNTTALTPGAYPDKPPQLLTEKQGFARQQQIKRLRHQFGENTLEFKQALALYDKGIRRTPTTKAGLYDRKQVAKRLHTRLIELLQTAGGVHYDETKALAPSARAPTEVLSKQEFYSQRGFGALAHTFNTTTRATLPGTQYPVAFVWDARRVQVTDMPVPLLEIISIAVAQAWLVHPDHLPGYTQAASFDGIRDMPLAMQPEYGFHRIAVFTNPDYKSERSLRAARKHRRKDQKMADMEAQIARLTQMIEAQQ